VRPGNFIALVGLISVGCFEDSPRGHETTTTGNETSASEPSASTDDHESSATATTTDTEDVTTSPTTETDGDGTCPRGMQCLDAPAPDWTGPFVVTYGEGDRAPRCPETWPRRASVLHRGLQSDPASCSCLCTPPNTACAASVELYVDQACTLLDVAQPSVSGGCTQVFGASGLLVSASETSPPAACDGTPLVELPEPTWEATVSVCELGAPAQPCDEGSCGPVTEPGEALCILREGEHACPEGAYRVGQTFFSGWVDERECSSCSCGAPLNVDCGGTSAVERFASPDCSGDPTETMALDTCAPAAGSVRYVPANPGDCFTVQESTPLGGVTTTAVVTSCCTE
jgi:hypothetical protein